MRKRSGKGFIKAIFFFIFACLIASAALLFFKTPDFDTKAVTGLELEQKGFNIRASWDDMGCDTYYVTVDGENYHFVIPVEKNRCTIRNVALGRTYSVTVNGEFEDAVSEGAQGTILIEKLPQEISVNPDEFNGFAEETMQLKVKAEGEVSFKSSDRKIVTVSKDGVLTGVSDGHTWVKVRADSTGVYKKASTLVAVNVYPAELDKPAVPIATYVSGTRASLSWKPVDFATYYQVLKRNAATGKYELVKEVEEGATSAEFTRNEGLYVVKPFCNFKDRLLTGSVSDPAQVVGTGGTAKTYSKEKIIRTLDHSKLKRIATVKGKDKVLVPQSLSMTKDSYVVSYINRKNTEGRLQSYSRKDGSFLGRAEADGIGHANGATCNPNTGNIYVTKTYVAMKTLEVAVFDADSKKSKGTIELPTLANGIAYDESNDKFYLSRLGKIHICDSSFNIEKTIKKSIRYIVSQDIAAYNGVVLVCTWIEKSESYIDLYRASDGAYLGSISVPIGEIESCVVDDGYLVILMNELHTYDDAIYKTKERIPLP
ncbi:MAG: hypothetical protein ACSW8G_05310 [Bacillota bacterium]